MDDRIKIRTEKELAETEAKLQELRIKWRDGSPATKKIVEVIAKIQTEKRDNLAGKLKRLNGTVGF